MNRRVDLPDNGVLGKDFLPFGRLGEYADWREIAFDGFEDIELKGERVDLSRARFRRGHFLEFSVTRSILKKVKFDDCQMIKSQFEEAELDEVVFLDSNVSHSLFESCSVKRGEVSGGSIAGCRFKNCVVDGLLIAGGADAAKLNFEACTVFMIHDAPFQGNLTFKDCRGRVLFTRRSAPSRLFNRSHDVEYYLAEASSLRSLRAVWTMGAQDAIRAEELESSYGLRKLRIADQSVVNAFDVVVDG